MVPFESLNAVSYSPSIVSMAQSESCIISEIKRDIGRKSRFLPRDAMHKRGLCGHVVSVRPSVDHVKTNKDIFEIFFMANDIAIFQREPP